MLETEYEKSKLRVFQDTLLCKRSIIEVQLLCKEEVIRRNTRVNKQIREHEYELQVFNLFMWSDSKAFISSDIVYFWRFKKIKDQFETGFTWVSPVFR